MRARLGDPVVERDLAAGRATRHHHVVQVARAGQHRPRFPEQRLRDHRHRGAAVVQEVTVVVPAHHGVDRDRHRPDLDRAPERGEELGRVEQQAEHALLRAHPQVQQRVARAVDQLLQPSVGQCALLVEERGLLGSAFRDVTVDEEARRVEAGRHRAHARLRRVPRLAGRRFWPDRADAAARGEAAGRAGVVGFTAIASISTSSSGSTSRETTRMVLGG